CHASASVWSPGGSSEGHLEHADDGEDGDHEQDQEDGEAHLGDGRGDARDPAEAQRAGNQGDQAEDDGVLEHGHSSLGRRGGCGPRCGNPVKEPGAPTKKAQDSLAFTLPATAPMSARPAAFSFTRATTLPMSRAVVAPASMMAESMMASSSASLNLAGR